MKHVSFISSLVICFILASEILVIPQIEGKKIKFSTTKVIKGKVTKVSDGDTITVNTGKKTYKIRLKGIDTPETSRNQKFEKDISKVYVAGEFNIFLKIPPSELLEIGKKAKSVMKHLIEGKIVEVELERSDKYDRSLGWVFYNGTLINAYLVYKGLAKPYMYKGSKYELSIIQAEKKAILAKKGIYKYLN